MLFPISVYPGVQFTYRVITNGQRINSKTLEKLGLNIAETYYDPNLPGYPAVALTASMLEEMKKIQGVEKIEDNLIRDTSYDDYGIFPFSDNYNWTRDFYGPVWIPEKGASVELNLENLPLYERIIRDYEHNELIVKQSGEILINGEIADSYTFKQNYYFMMGDNRHNSLDSRYWGFVPEDHIVGTPTLVWLSTNRNAKFPNNIRWNRFFKFV